MPQCRTLPSQSGELELVHTVKQEALQVGLTDSTDGIDVGTGAVIFGEISCQTKKQKWFSLK